MKDIVFTVKQQKLEMKIALGCLIFAILLNITSIIVYDTEWKEIYTQALWTLILTIISYGLTIFFRILYYFIKIALKR